MGASGGGQLTPLSEPKQRTGSWGKRFYTLPNGKEYPSVTTILQAVAKPALVAWAANTERELVVEAAAALWEDVPTTAKMSRAAFTATLRTRLGEVRAHQRKLSEAGDIGKQVHALIEWNLRREMLQVVGPEPQISREASVSFASFQKWRETAKLEPVRIEQVVWSDIYGFAGTMDLHARILGDCMVIADWKTGKAVYPEARMQVAAYRQAYIEMGHADQSLHGMVLRLPKNPEDPAPECVLIPPADCDRYFDVFLNVKALWQWLEDMKS